MNRTYKLVWNAVQQGWVVASELGKSRKKSKPVGLLLVAAALGAGQVVMAAPATRAIPVLGSIASGTATITAGTAGDGRTLLTIDQTSDKLIANWTSFEVGQFSRVTFNQPTVSSLALNRIAGTAPSQIFGQVQANGQLILVNPAGMVFGPSARINAASVIASTLDITDANFNAGILQFDRGTSTGAIDIQKQGDNQGIIMAENGNTFVFAPTVTNSGTVRAQAGNVTIANGNRLTVDATSGTATLNQVSGIAGLIQSTGVIRGDRLTTTDKGKVFIVGDRARTGSVVNLAGDITSTGNDIKARTLNITGDLKINANTNINAINSINVNGALNVDGNNRLISVDYDNDAAGDDYLYFGENGRISMPGNTITYREKGVTYNIIRTLAQLQAIGDNSTTLADKYVLGGGIDASSTVTNAFTPIGSTENTPFTGVISGLGNGISNLTINTPNASGVGLFGYAQNSTIKSIKLVNVSIAGKTSVGGLVGQSGTYSSNMAANGATLFNNSIAGAVNGLGFNNSNDYFTHVGGLVGASYATLVNYNNSSAAVESNYNNVGGLIGYSAGSTISHNSSSGNVSGSTSTSDNVGGLIGNASSSTINNNYTSGTTTGRNYIGGLIGQSGTYDSTNQITDNSVSGLVDGASRVGGLIGADIYSNISQNNSTVTVEAGQDYAGGLIGIAESSDISDNYAIGNVRIGIDQPVDAGTNYAGGLIGSYKSITSSQLIQRNYARGNVSSNYPNRGGSVGGLIGWLRLGDATHSSSLTINSNYATGNITGVVAVGGLIGRIGVVNSSNLLVQNNFALGTIDGQSGSYDRLSGFIGSIGGSGKVALQNNYANGQILGGSGDKIGGLIGGLDNSDLLDLITSSFNYWNANLNTILLGIGDGMSVQPSQMQGLTDGQMKQLSSYSGWDISNQLTGSNSIWYINEGVSTPVLRALMTP